MLVAKKKLIEYNLNMITKKKLPPCPVAVLLKLIGNKWKVLIIRDLLTGTKRFGELKKSVGCSQKVLTANLRELEESKLLLRRVFAEVPPRVEYALSELGESMRPIIKALEIWGADYQELVRNA